MKSILKYTKMKTALEEAYNRLLDLAFQLFF